MAIEYSSSDALLRGGVRELLWPRSAVVVGASSRFTDTIEGVAAGDIAAWGVHPSHSEVAGLPCAPRIADLPETPELALLLVGHARVEQAFEDAVAAGVRAFVLPGLGAEAGVAAAPVIARIASRAAEVGASVLGPNCMGVATPGGTSFWLGSVPETAISGHVSVVAQSGSIAEAMIASGPRIGLRTVISCGGEAVRDVADFVAFLAADEGTRAIGLFLETVRRPRAFAAALEACALAGKPVVCLKVGRSPAGARAALAHTGALVGSDRALAAVMRRFGVIPVDDLHDLLETLEVLGARRPRPSGRRFGAISESGGECALLADRADDAGISFAPLAPELASSLTAEFPNFLLPQNPLDAWAIDEAEVVYPRSLELMASSGTFDVLLAQVDLSRFREESSNEWCELIVRALAEAVDGTGIFPAVTSAGSSDPPSEIAAAARALDVPLLRGAGHAMRALAAVTAWTPAPPRREHPDGSIELDDLLVRGGGLPEHESALVLERYGIAVAARRRAGGSPEAVAAAEAIGFPVVVKVDGPAHKSRAGGVVLGLEDARAVRAAAEKLGGRVLVARQVPAGPECFCGMFRDAEHGAVLAVGRGGDDVEGTRPVVCLAPVERELAVELIRDAGLPDDAEPLADALVALGRIATEHPSIEAVDINPLILTPDGPVAVDALVVVSNDVSP
jgi:acyl-CoA synthetase (NDP forming)